MTEQLIRDRLADTEKWLERFAAVTVDIAMLKVMQASAVSKGQLSDEATRILGLTREERDLAMSALKTELKAAFGDALKESFKEYAEAQEKRLRLYTRIGLALLAILILKDIPTAFTVARAAIGL